MGSLIALIIAVAIGWPEIQAIVLPQPPAPVQSLSPVVPPPVAIGVAAEPAAQPVPPSSDLDDRLSRLEKSSADSATVLRLADRVEQLEQNLRELQSRRKGDAALVLSIGLLKNAVDQGAPFDTELRALKILAPDDADIAQTIADLKPRAASGIPARSALLERFAPLESAIIRADILPAPEADGGSTWQRRSLERVLTLFTLRREDGQVEGTSTAAIVARARNALDHNDWPDALHQLAALTGEAAKIAQPWLAEVQARLDADRDLNGLAANAVVAAGLRL